MKKKINVVSMFRNKNRSSLFSIHQFYNKVKIHDSSIDVKFHIIWDDNKELGDDNKKYSELIDNMFGNIITSYSKEFLKNYCKTAYNVPDDKTNLFDNFYLIYRILLGHYLRRTELLEYFIILDDDIIINGDLNDPITYALSTTPFLISEPMNCNCDKVLMSALSNIYGDNQFGETYRNRNRNMLGFNAGFQGIDACIFDDFLSPVYFHHLLSIFDYTSTKNPDGTEFFGVKRFLLDTQEQSFFSCMNMCKSRCNPIILNPNKYFVVPNWGTHPTMGEIDYKDENEGWTIALKSEIVHFIGHTQGKGKSVAFLNRMDAYLDKNNLLLK